MILRPRLGRPRFSTDVISTLSNVTTQAGTFRYWPTNVKIPNVAIRYTALGFLPWVSTTPVRVTLSAPGGEGDWATANLMAWLRLMRASDDGRVTKRTYVAVGYLGCPWKRIVRERP